MGKKRHLIRRRWVTTTVVATVVLMPIAIDADTGAALAVSNPIPKTKTFGFESEGVAGTLHPTKHGRPSKTEDGKGDFGSGAVGGANTLTEVTYGDSPSSAPEGAGYATKVVIGEEDDSQRIDTLTPDEAGRVEKRVSSYGPSSETTYDEWDRVVKQVTGKAGGIFQDVSATVEMAYDERGRLVKQRRKQTGLASSGWAEIIISYDERDQVETIAQDGLASETLGGSLVSGTTAYSYLSDGLLGTVKSPGDVIVDYGYDTAGRVKETSRVGAAGTRHTAYDAMGRVVFTTDGDAGVWRGRYDAWGNLYEEELPDGTLIQRSYDRAGGLLQEQILSPEAGELPPRTVLVATDYVVNSFGGVERVTEHLGPSTRVTTQAFDSSGRPTTTTVGAGSPSERVVSDVEYLNDQTGRVGRITDAGNNVTTLSYSSAAPWPDQVEVSEMSSSGVPPLVTTKLTLDALGRGVREEVLGGGVIVHRSFDEAGNLLSTKLGGGSPNRTTMTYDSAGSVLTIRRDDISAEQSFAYDLDGRAKSLRVRRNNGFETTDFDYDAVGRLTFLNRPGSLTPEHFTYNPDDTIDERTTRQTNATGVPLVLKHSYDAANRLLGIDLVNRALFEGVGLPDGLEQLDFGDVYVFDDLSRPTLAAERVGENPDDLRAASKISLTYAAGDPRTLPENEGVGGWETVWGGPTSISRTYDIHGNAGHLGIPAGLPGNGDLLSYDMVHDNLDRVEHVDGGGGLVNVSYSWGGAARLYDTSTRSGAGVVQRYSYDHGSALLSSLETTSGAGNLGVFGFVWDGASGNKRQRSVLSSGPGGVTDGLSWTWAPDVVGRLWSAGSGTGATSFGLTSPPITGWTYGLGAAAYGKADEMLAAISDRGVELFDASGPEGRLVEYTEPGEEPETFDYDSMGRRTADEIFAYTWDWRGRLKQVDVAADAPRNAGERIVYDYDASGRLLTREHQSPAPGGGDERSSYSKRLFLWDGNSLAAEIGLNYDDKSLWSRQYVPGPSGLDDSPQVRIETGLLPGGTEPYNEAYYAFVRDEMGTVIAVLEDVEAPTSGTAIPPLLARVLYDPYGQAHVEEGPELRSVEHDPEMTNLDGIDQADLTLGPPENPVIGIAGGVVVTTSMALDEATLEAGLTVESCDTGYTNCVTLGPAEVVVARDDTDATQLHVMPVAGWLEDRSYRVRLSTDLADAYERTFTVPGGGAEYVVSIATLTGVEATDDPLPSLPQEIPLIFDTMAAASATLDCDGEPCFPGGLNLLFQGLWHDPLTGIAYARNRWYDARTAHWLSPDPMEAFDSPNQYAFVAWGPHMYTDPTGEFIPQLVGGAVSVGIGYGLTCMFEGCDQYSWVDAGVDFGLGAATVGLSNISKLKHLGKVGRFATRAGAEAGLDIGAEVVRHELKGEDYTLGQLAVGSVVNFGIGEAGALGSRGLRRFWNRGGGSVPGRGGSATRYGGDVQRVALLNRVREAGSLSEAKGLVYGTRRMRALGYSLEDISLEYRGKQGVDLAFSKGKHFAILEAKSSPYLSSLKTYSGLRQGTGAYNVSRLQRYSRFGDGTHDEFVRRLIGEAAAGHLQSFGSLYRTRRLFQLPTGWPHTASPILR